MTWQAGVATEPYGREVGDGQMTWQTGDGVATEAYGREVGGGQMTWQTDDGVATEPYGREVGGGQESVVERGGERERE